MEPTDCAVSYSAAVKSTARSALARVLPPSEYMAAHVRALREAGSKAECTDEWVARLVRT